MSKMSQAHTGHWGQINRNRGSVGQVSKDWQKMRTDLEERKNGEREKRVRLVSESASDQAEPGATADRPRE